MAGGCASNRNFNFSFKLAVFAFPANSGFAQSSVVRVSNIAEIGNWLWPENDVFVLAEPDRLSFRPVYGKTKPIRRQTWGGSASFSCPTVPRWLWCLVQVRNQNLAWCVCSVASQIVHPIFRKHFEKELRAENTGIQMAVVCLMFH